MTDTTPSHHFLKPVDPSLVKEKTVQNEHRRFEKAHTSVHYKPRKDWHNKAFKNPAENLTAIAQGAAKKTKMHFTKLAVLGVMGGSTCSQDFFLYTGFRFFLFISVLFDFFYFYIFYLQPNFYLELPLTVCLISPFIYSRWYRSWL